MAKLLELMELRGLLSGVLNIFTCRNLEHVMFDKYNRRELAVGDMRLPSVTCKAMSTSSSTNRYKTKDLANHWIGQL